MEYLPDLISEVGKHKDFMNTIRDRGFTIADPMDHLLVFDEAFNNILDSRTNSKTGDHLV